MTLAFLRARSQLRGIRAAIKRGDLGTLPGGNDKVIGRLTREIILLEYTIKKLRASLKDASPSNVSP